MKYQNKKFSVGGWTPELDKNWERTFGKKGDVSPEPPEPPPKQPPDPECPVDD